MHRLTFCLSFILVLFMVYAQQKLPKDVLKIIKRKERIVTRLAETVTELFENRAKYLKECNCSRHACTNDLSEYTCTKKLGSVDHLCGNKCKARRISFESSIFRTPPGTDVRKLNDCLKESICLYRNMDPLMKKLIAKEKTPSWIYFGSVDGSQRIYPAATRERCLENGDPLLNGCRQYDPRIRPWFIGASTQPKDVVLLLDISDSMNKPMDHVITSSRWHFAKKAVLAMLETLASFDYVNIVTFADSASRLYLGGPLVQGTEENLKMLSEKVQEQQPSKKTNFVAAFGEAFSVFKEACTHARSQDGCSHCQKVILFLTEGRDSSLPKGEIFETRTLLQVIEEEQQKLEVDATSSRAKIFTFSIGESSDDSIPKQISCANNGSWSLITSDTDPRTAMNTYYRFLTNYDEASSPVWLNPFKDDGGLGNVSTVSKAVYSRGTADDLDGVFLGVASHDVFVKDFEVVPDVIYEDVLKELVERSARCKQSLQSPCQLQVHRNADKPKSVCTDPVSSNPNITSFKDSILEENICYRRHKKYYKLFTAEKKTWNQAKQKCEEEKGRLAVAGSDEELFVLAGIAPHSGSWIGARLNYKYDVFEWEHPTASNETLVERTDYWATGEPNYHHGNEDCVQIDRRGAKGNLYSEHCKISQSFICEYKTFKSCAKVLRVPKKGYFSLPPVDKCVRENKSLANAGPHPLVKLLSTPDVMCPLGENICTAGVICCPNCKQCSKEENKKCSGN